MSKMVVGAVLSMTALLYPITWQFGVPAAQQAVERELMQELEAKWRALGTSEAQPAVRVGFGRGLPVLPGVVLISFHPSVNGKGPCTAGTAVVFWYGAGTSFLYAPWRGRLSPQPMT